MIENITPTGQKIELSTFLHHDWNIILYWKGKLHSISTLPKIRIPSKKASNKSCLELNFVQKSPRAHMSIPPPPSGAMELERLIWLKYSYIALKRQFTFNLGLNAGKNTYAIKTNFRCIFVSVKCCPMFAGWRKRPSPNVREVAI